MEKHRFVFLFWPKLNEHQLFSKTICLLGFSIIFIIKTLCLDLNPKINQIISSYKLIYKINNAILIK